MFYSKIQTSHKEMQTFHINILKKTPQVPHVFQCRYQVGKASPTEGTLPSSVYIILKYMESFEDAVKANAMVGGDNASRSVAIGMVLGAYHGVEGIPANLREELNAWERCDALLEKLPLISALSQRSEL